MARWAHLIVVFLALQATACCIDCPKPLAKCGVAVDTTSYATHVETERFIDDSLLSFATANCGWMGFAAISGRSQGTSCQRPALELVANEQENPNSSPRRADQVRRFKLGNVNPSAQWLRTCHDGSPGSDILGSLRALADTMQAGPKGLAGSQIVIYSDLMNNVEPLRLDQGDYSQAGARAAKVRDLRAANQLPVFRDKPTITVRGFNLLVGRDPSRAPQVKLMWLDIFAASGAGEVTFP
ncbi:hypothetical protein Acor_80820 [Acrocarpospora corrugata]|uniref:Lipoprotein n=1 Tax=Acrocarpospora corrugata TaxID=35763 RepID=A0A5M3WFU3_9ACTN|nr:hypothetical protein [Acrocarpospora corrugata]GES06013.1 hypothetical protein Acor_80820 [Acrocarpospora corrugata]